MRAVCAGGCGPGNPHLTNGLFDAQIGGFTLHASRTILSGAADERVELAETNLRQPDIE